MLNFCLMLKSPSLTTSVSSCNNGRGGSCSVYWRRRRKAPVLLQVSAASYQKFVDFAVNETKRHAVLAPSPLQEKYNTLVAMDGKTELKMSSFQAPKIRLLRSMSIQNEVMQVLDFAVFPKPEFDVPIFCANFFTAASTNIVVLDLNPLHDVIHHRDYKDKYYKSLMPLGLNYTKLLPWGGRLTSESIKFFSPIVIWTKFTSSQDKHDALYSAFMEYYKAWLKLMDQAVEETDVSQIMCNCEAQHRYLTWRAEKDPGHGVLKKLIGETLAADLLGNFLFNGIKELGSKKFLDYFPEYCCEDGTVNEKRSIIGKSFEHRPWDSGGEFVGDNLKVN
ncbi:Phytochromobilin:ferredoxin oxidoreductase [Citrus sinensis]|uniref:phytochromobilin:ferredoxin oxidoreductase, chloroplastic isoform X1 n=1 Tax=Citrus sinensis TaxID=2711 RepID=UPI00218FC0AA|nr:phytochromobilin:ferredoxin oxidoreductase, chloroplastic isoform X1 [Citrus sinensis]KAH9741590.1 Phytochromobilin:ferredoxin oxidoreductase [Citrus sinensis]